METLETNDLEALHAREGMTSDDLAPLAGLAPPAAANPLPPLFMTGAELRQIRGAVGLSQRDLAQALGYSRDVVYRWETQDMVIPRQMMAHILTQLLAARRELEEWREQRALMLQWTPIPRDRRASTTRPRRNKSTPLD
jgi:DNA-binding XRE family transcriptional regulator